mmetsp:Transcript_95331/g.308854  ORF Transcript_95331/g.308854 Transcript_95331/m.308854 type:complete len:254 (+) Transcript_95331:775-1536(+)
MARNSSSSASTPSEDVHAPRKLSAFKFCTCCNGPPRICNPSGPKPFPDKSKSSSVSRTNSRPRARANVPSGPMPLLPSISTFKHFMFGNACAKVTAPPVRKPPELKSNRSSCAPRGPKTAPRTQRSAWSQSAAVSAVSAGSGGDAPSSAVNSRTREACEATGASKFTPASSNCRRTALLWASCMTSWNTRTCATATSDSFTTPTPKTRSRKTSFSSCGFRCSTRSRSAATCDQNAEAESAEPITITDFKWRNP